MKKRELWVDLLKIICAFLVIILHAVSYGIWEKDLSPSTIIYYIGTFAIPLFFMISGYLQLRKDNIDYKYVFKKIKKILIVVVCWNFIEYLKQVYAGNSIMPFVTSYNSLLQRGYFYHFWYLGSLIILYLLLPILNKLFKKQPKYFIIFTIIMTILCVSIDIFNIITCNINGILVKDRVIQTYRLWTWVTYYCLGGCITKLNNYKISKRTHLLIMIGLIIITLGYEYMFALKLYNNLYAENFYDSLLVLVTSFTIFTYFRRITINNKDISDFIILLSSLTMGIYIIHKTVLEYFIITDNNYMNLMVAISVFILSTTISFVISKIPKIKELIKI